MKKSKQIRFGFPLIVIATLLFWHCSPIRHLPPESDIVNENGSRPPGFYRTLKSADIDIDAIACNSQNRYSPYLVPFSKISAAHLKKILNGYLHINSEKKAAEVDEILNGHVKWSMVRGVLIEGNNNNLGVIRLKGMTWKDNTGNSHPLLVFRNAFTPAPEGESSCFRTLLIEGKIKHVINLYDGEMDLNDLIKQERRVASELGATYVRTAELSYGKWRYQLRTSTYGSAAYRQAEEQVAALIFEQILMPGGVQPKGNILIHCGGGMHRTGMIVGIMERVINQTPDKRIEAAYRYHTSYKNEKVQGGYEAGNVNFIMKFRKKLILKKLEQLER